MNKKINALSILFIICLSFSVVSNVKAGGSWEVGGSDPISPGSCTLTSEQEGMPADYQCQCSYRNNFSGCMMNSTMQGVRITMVDENGSLIKNIGLSTNTIDVWGSNSSGSSNSDVSLGLFGLSINSGGSVSGSHFYIGRSGGTSKPENIGSLNVMKGSKKASGSYNGFNVGWLGAPGKDVYKIAGGSQYEKFFKEMLNAVGKEGTDASAKWRYLYTASGKNFLQYALEKMYGITFTQKQVDAWIERYEDRKIYLLIEPLFVISILDGTPISWKKPIYAIDPVTNKPTTTITNPEEQDCDSCKWNYYYGTGTEVSKYIDASDFTHSTQFSFEQVKEAIGCSMYFTSENKLNSGYQGANTVNSCSGSSVSYGAIKNGNSGYAMGVFRVTGGTPGSGQVCNYFSSEHFKENSQNNDGTGNSGPNGENCCTYIVDHWKDYDNLKNKSEDEAKKQIMRDHPECYYKINRKKSNVTENRAYCITNFSSLSLEQYTNSTRNNTMVLNDYAASPIDANNYVDNDLYYMISTVSTNRGNEESNIIQGNNNHTIYIRKYLTKYGKLLCTEKVKVNFPKTYTSSVGAGYKLVWPTTDNNFGLPNRYPLTMSGEAKCIIYFDSVLASNDCFEHKNVNGYLSKSDLDTCVNGLATNGYTIAGTNYIGVQKAAYNIFSGSSSTTAAIENNLYNLNANIKVEYDDDDYGNYNTIGKYTEEIPNNNSIIRLKPYDRKTTAKINGTNANFNSANSWHYYTGSSSQILTINQTVKYEINDYIYRYILKKDGYYDRSVNSNSQSFNYSTYKFSDVRHGNLPISTTAKYYTSADKSSESSGTSKALALKYMDIGGFGVSGTVDPNLNILTTNHRFVRNAFSEYKCDYFVTEPVTCNCLSSTVNSGMELRTCMLGGCDGNRHSCAEARRLFCTDSTQVPDYKVSCQSGTTYAGNKILTEKCNGNSLCKELMCNEITCSTGNKEKVITDYVAEYIKNKKIDNIDLIDSNGKKTIYFKNLISSLENTEICGNKSIIYREIDLDNPFPGQAIALRKIGSGVFSKNNKSRVPGFNWNDVDLVKNKITKNSGTENDDIYIDSKPMYQITLTPAKIKKIKEYNESHNYDDFTLDCESNSEGGTNRNCISTFLRNKDYNLLDNNSSCKGASKTNPIYECKNRSA